MFVAAAVVVVALYLWRPVDGWRVPRGVVAIDWLLMLAFVTGARLAARTLIERPGRGRFVARGREALIIGAGDAGQLIIREMLKTPRLGYTAIGLIDDHLVDCHVPPSR